MDKFLGKEYPEGETRIRFLKDNCDKVVEKGYSKRFTPEQIATMKSSLSDVSIAINDKEVEKKAFNDQIKAVLKPLLEEKKDILAKLKNKAEFVTEQCFKFVDKEERITAFYNGEGDLIDFRPCNPDELQGTIFQISRNTGTHD